MDRSRSAQFRSLYARYFRAVWSVVGQLGIYGAAREDAVQEVWIIAYRRLHTLQPQASPRAWLCSIARKVVWRMRRNAQRFDRRIDAFADEPRTPLSDASARYEVVATVQAALESLSEAQRSVLVLTSVHGFTAPEVADALALPINTVYSRLRLARRRLAEHEVQRSEVEAELEARDRPPEELRQRVLSAILPIAPLSVPLGASTIKAFALGGVVGGLAVAATVATTDPPPPRAQPAEPAASVTAAERTASVEAPPTRADVERPSPDVAASPARPSGSNKRARDAPAPAVDEPAPPEEEPAAPSLDVEADLLARAQRASRSGQPDKALRLLRQHALQFPQGRLVDVREGAFVRVLCLVGRPEDASAHAAQLAARRPDSPIATAVEEVCSERSDGSKPPGR